MSAQFTGLLKKLPLTFFSIVICQSVFSQNIAQKEYVFKDSIVVRVHPSYDSVSNTHLWFFGDNYRKEWSAKVKLPLIHISKAYGGLTPMQEGGGMQSKSLRLKDKNGKEWVIRSVEKTPEKLLPENLKGTFAVDWVDDAMSGQHPFSALIVPPLAAAAGVHHTNPVIGVMATDQALGEYSKTFSGMVVLIEEREPAGDSDNSIKMLKELNEDHDHRLNALQFLRARLLDVLTGDWDRHEDQWRWVSHKQGKDKIYEAVPRDRDQVFHVNQGLFPSIAALPWINPLFGDFNGDLSGIRYSLFKTRFTKAAPDAQLSYTDYMHVVQEFVKAETDDVLEAGLKRLPKEIYGMRHDQLLLTLKQRRDGLPAAMDSFYKFINKIVDIRTSDKNEQVIITGTSDKAMHIVINKLDKSGDFKDLLMDITYDPAITKEIRLYVSAGNDRISIDNASSPIKLRIIGGPGNKSVEVKQSYKRILLYDKKDSSTYSGQINRLSKHLSNDTLNTTFIPTNPYHIWMPLANIALNADDGFLLGLGFKFTGKNGFRKLPYSSVQQLLVSHSFATNAFRLKYSGEWIKAIGKADLTVQTFIQAPDNTMNFFGLGNETVLVKEGEYRRFYRTRFDTYQFDPALRWHTDENTTISVGPSLQFYHLNRDDNDGRFIEQYKNSNTAEGNTVDQDKAHLGLLINYVSNKRNQNILPSKGYYLSVVLQAYSGLNQYSKSFAQIKPEFTFYQKINSSGTIVLSDRIGGGVSIGNPAFYQSMFLGGQGNLLGYLQNRFAGQHMIYNNLQARVKLANIASYILPGQLGITGFYDAGRVWIKEEQSDKWHQGAGGGLYFAPAGLTIFQVLAGHSEEGWYPYVSMNFRL